MAKCPLTVKKVKLSVGLMGKRTESGIESLMADRCVCGHSEGVVEDPLKVESNGNKDDSKCGRA